MNNASRVFVALAAIFLTVSTAAEDFAPEGSDAYYWPAVSHITPLLYNRTHWPAVENWTPMAYRVDCSHCGALLR